MQCIDWAHTLGFCLSIYIREQLPKAWAHITSRFRGPGRPNLGAHSIASLTRCKLCYLEGQTLPTHKGPSTAAEIRSEATPSAFYHFRISIFIIFACNYIKNKKNMVFHDFWWIFRKIFFSFQKSQIFISHDSA